MLTSPVHSQIFLLSPPEPHFLIIKVPCIFMLQKGIFFHFMSELKPGAPLGYSSLLQPSVRVAFGFPSLT